LLRASQSIVLFGAPAGSEERTIRTLRRLIPLNEELFAGHACDIPFRHFQNAGRGFGFATVLVVAVYAVPAFWFDKGLLLGRSEFIGMILVRQDGWSFFCKNHAAEIQLLTFMVFQCYKSIKSISCFNEHA
jgi:hypothetical protein